MTTVAPTRRLVAVGTPFVAAPTVATLTPYQTVVFSPQGLSQAGLKVVLDELFGEQPYFTGFPETYRQSGRRDSRVLMSASPVGAFCGSGGYPGLRGNLETLLPQGGSIILLDFPESAGVFPGAKRLSKCNPGFHESTFRNGVIAAARILHQVVPAVLIGAYLMHGVPQPEPDNDKKATADKTPATASAA